MNKIKFKYIVKSCLALFGGTIILTISKRYPCACMHTCTHNVSYSKKWCQIRILCACELAAVLIPLLILLCCADKPTLGPEHLSELFDIVKGAKAKWRNIGTSMGFSHEELSEIPHTIGLTDDTGYFQELLQRWLNRAPPRYSFPRVEELASALREVRMDRTAYNLEHHSFTGL